MRSAISRIVIALATVGSVLACTFVDGVSDLQGGKKPGTSDGGRDALAPDEDAAFQDARVPDDGGVLGASCGALRCPGTTGCCVLFTNGAKVCTAPAQCTSGDGMFLQCTSAKSCPASAPVCCFDFGDEASSCVAACGAGQQELCNAAEAKPCLGTRTCSQTLQGTSDVRVCQ